MQVNYTMHDMLAEREQLREDNASIREQYAELSRTCEGFEEQRNEAWKKLEELRAKRVWCPPGWRLVPEEPTIEMVDAAFVWGLDREKIRAAIQAAPEPAIEDRSG